MKYIPGQYLRGGVEEYRQTGSVSRRNFLGGAAETGGLAGLTRALGALVKPRVAHAQGNASPPTSTPTVGYSRYKSVDDILEGLPFIAVNKDTFEQEKVNEDVVLFFYNSQYDQGGFNHRLARVFKEVLRDRYGGIKFLSYDRSKEPTVPQSFYLKEFKFSGEPFVGFYRNGEEIFRIDGGPKSDEYTAQWIPWLKEQIKIKFNRGS